MVGVEWSVLPPGSRDLPEDDHGFRGYVVENHTQASDITIQNAHQSVSDFKSLLQTLKARHPRLTECDRESDGASATYNNKATSIFMAEMGRSSGGRVWVRWRKFDEDVSSKITQIIRLYLYSPSYSS